MKSTGHVMVHSFQRRPIHHPSVKRDANAFSSGTGLLKSLDGLTIVRQVPLTTHNDGSGGECNVSAICVCHDSWCDDWYGHADDEVGSPDF